MTESSRSRLREYQLDADDVERLRGELKEAVVKLWPDQDERYMAVNTLCNMALKSLTLSETAAMAEKVMDRIVQDNAAHIEEQARNALKAAVIGVGVGPATSPSDNPQGFASTVRDLRRYAACLIIPDDMELVQHAADVIEVLSKRALTPSHAAPVGEDAIQQIMWAIFSYADRREEFAAARLGGPRDVAREAMQAQEKHIRGLLAQLMPSATPLRRDVRAFVDAVVAMFEHHHGDMMRWPEWDAVSLSLRKLPESNVETVPSERTINQEKQ
jgi:predicted protein tyrosine phosphatase